MIRALFQLKKKKKRKEKKMPDAMVMGSSGSP